MPQRGQAGRLHRLRPQLADCGLPESWIPPPDQCLSPRAAGKALWEGGPGLSTLGEGRHLGEDRRKAWEVAQGCQGQGEEPEQEWLCLARAQKERMGQC